MKLNQAHIMKPTPPIELHEPTEAEIQKEAYYLWIENGRPEGHDHEIWHTARAILRHAHGHADAHYCPPAGSCIFRRVLQPSVPPQQP